MSDQVDQLREALAERYDLQREVGRGAKAVVYLARDLKHDRPVAIKVLRPEFSAGLGGERFLKEIGIASRMTHPHILPLFDSGQAAGASYYVTPFVEGPSLRDRIREEGRLPVPEAVQLACQIGEALDHAHRKGVVHRDIKPENILLEEGKAVVADFGIARALTAAGADTLTATGVALGTPQYMSPEQAAGGEEVDGRADLYALGCVLFEMLTGRPPFTAPTARGVLAHHLSQPPPSPLAERPELPLWLDRAVLKLMAKSPEERYETAASLTAELAAYSEAKLEAVSDRWMRWLYRLHERRRPALAGALVLLLALVAGGYLLYHSGPSFPGPSHPEAASRATIAILPFEDHSEEDNSRLAAGLTAYLTDHFGGVEPLRVVSAATVREHLRTGLTVDSIVARYGVGTLVEGGQRVTDRQIQVWAELVDPSSGIRLAGTGRLTRPRQETVLLLGELADEVARLLRMRLGFELERQELRAGTDCAPCLELLFRAAELRDQVRALVQAGDTGAARRTLVTADSILLSIEAMDPAWEAPAIERGWLELYRARLFTPRAGSYDAAACSLGIAHAQRVLERNPASAPALELRGILRSYLAQAVEDPGEVSRYWEGAQEDLTEAVRLDRHRAGAWSTLSLIHWQNGRRTEAKQAAETALAADAWLFYEPTILVRLCQATLELEELDEAYRWCIQEGRRRFPRRTGFVSAELILLTLWERWAPDPDLAWALADTLVELSPPHRREGNRAQVSMDVAAVLARNGQADSARAVIARARGGVSTDDPSLDYREAHARLRLGEREEALRLLERYLTALPDRRERVAKDPWFKALRGDPAFRRITEEPEG